MEQYDVYLYDIPRVSEDGKRSLPIKPHRTEQLAELEAACRHAAEHKGEFDRAIVIRTIDDQQKMVLRYIDGEEVEIPEEREEAERSL